jgi:N-acetylglucosaminyl-diphospho-decaprenol L-rhamnosyltransferase
MVELSIIIVTWNSEDEIENCLDSILKFVKNINYEIIVVDNYSNDCTLDKLNKYKSNIFKIIKLNENFGYTKGVNSGIENATGNYILLLNPDVEILEDSINILFDFLKDNINYGAVCPLLRYANGGIQHSIRNFPDYKTFFFEFTLLSLFFSNSKLFGSWRMMYFDFNKDQDVNQPMAAALMIKKEVLKIVSNFDNRFTMFFNDVDICKKIIDNGFKIRYLKNSKMIHKKGTSIYKDRKNMIDIWNKDCIKYFRKYHNNIILINWLSVNLFFSGFIRKTIYTLFKK